MTTKESIYKTMHYSHPGYRNNNQGMAVLCDWLHLLRYEDGTVYEPWSKRPKISVIEIGCGNGKLCHLLSCLTFDVTGIDIADGPYEREGYKFAIADITQNVCELALEKNEYDYCISFDVLEHISEKEVPIALKTMDHIAKNIILKVACSGEPPLHLCVKSVGWWLNQLTIYLPNFSWEIVRLYNMYPQNEKQTFAPLFYGKKEPKHENSDAISDRPEG